MIKERLILFSAPMVEAILSGRKTQTRRIIKGNPGAMDVRFLDGDDDTKGREIYSGGGLWVSLSCPYGMPGDQLWVRETWRTLKLLDKTKPKNIANGAPFGYKTSSDTGAHLMGRWRPSIFMPRWASRINLRVTGVRAERVQDISEADCQTEGLKILQGGIRAEFAVLWDSINEKKHPWSANPWVWVISFEVING